MELNVVMKRFIEGIAYIDRNDGQLRTNQRTKAPYLPGLPLIPEADLTHLFARWWREKYSDDFNYVSMVVHVWTRFLNLANYRALMGSNG